MDSFWELCQNPGLASEVSLQPLKRFDLDYAIVFSDILVIAKAFGCSVAFSSDGLRLSEIRALSDIHKDADARIACYAPVYETLAKIRAILAPEKRLIGFAGGPWTLACYMSSGANARDRQIAAKLWAYRKPQEFQKFLQLLAEEVAAHLIAQLQAGADTVQIFESLAGNLPDAFFDRFVLEPTQYIVRRIRDVVSDAQIIGFPRQASLKSYARFAERSGVDVVSLDTAVPMDWAVQAIPGCSLQGNLDPAALLAGGRALEDAVASILHQTDGHRLIFNLGHGVLPETPVAHVAKLIGLVKTQS